MIVRRLPIDLALIPIVLFGAALRFHQVGRESLWLDELITITNATGYRPVLETVLPIGVVTEQPPDPTASRTARPWATMWRAEGREVHPPLYFVILREWRALFGDGDVAGRALSILASLIAIILIHDLGRLLFGTLAAARWASLLLTVAVPQVVFSQEVRGYTLLIALALGAACALERMCALGVNRPRTIALGLSCLALALTHYFAFGLLLAFALYALVALPPRDRRAAALALLAAACAFVALWGRFLWAQRVHTEWAFLLETPDGHRLRTATRLLELPGRYLVSAMFAAPPLAGRWLWLAAPLALIPPALLLRKHRALLLPALWLGFVIGFVAALDLLRSTRLLELLRYTLLASPALYLLIAGSFSQAGRLARHALPACALLVSLLALPAAYRPSKAGWRTMASAIGERAAPGDVLVFPVARVDDWWGFAWQLYSAVAHYAYLETRPVLMIDKPPPAPIMNRLRASSNLWVFSYTGLRVEQILPGCAATETLVFPGVTTLYRVADPARACGPALR